MNTSQDFEDFLEHEKILKELLFCKDDKRRKKIALLYKNSDSLLLSNVSKKVLKGEY